MARKTPEGYAVYSKPGTPAKVYIVKDETTTWEFSKCAANCDTGYTPGNSNKPIQSYVAGHEESYEWRKALNDDSDFDGIENGLETLTNPNAPDSDGHGIIDGREPNWNLNTDSDGKINALDKDSYNDGVADGTEDANRDGYRQAGETDMLVRDTDADGVQDGTEKGVTFATDTVDTCELATDPGCGVPAWLFTQDADTTKTTNALDQDSDDDGVCDGTCSGYSEDADADGVKDASETDAALADSDGDGIQDGTEKGFVTPLKDTDLTKFAPDKDPGTTTDPTKIDSENSGAGDGIADGVEDRNRNGKVDLGETDPNLVDTDADGLNDGLEDANHNGVQEKKADGTLMETDPLAKDSDVDGIADGLEALGTWCYAGGSCSNPVLDPMNPDKDGDGLRDGQEAAGWRIGIWYERTMEKKTDYLKTSDPTVADTDGDTLTDFSEFLNGSDARVQDTDGDGMRDDVEIQLKSNVTGIEGSPPQVTNVKLSIETVWETKLGFIPMPVSTAIKVEFDIADNVGIDKVQVRLVRAVGIETHAAQVKSGDLTGHITETFGFSIVEGLFTGADLNITAYDVNGNGAWGQFRVNSLVDVAVQAVVAVFAPIAKVVVEAASAALSWLYESAKWLLAAVLKPLQDAYDAFVREFAKLMMSLQNMNAEDAARGLIQLLIFSGFALAIFAVVVAVSVLEKIAIGATGGVVALVSGMSALVASLIIGLFVIVAVGVWVGSELIESYIPPNIDTALEWSFTIAQVIILLVLKERAFKPIRGVESALNDAILALVLLGAATALDLYCGKTLLCVGLIVAVDLIAFLYSLTATKDLAFSGRGISGVKQFYPFLYPVTVATTAVADATIFTDLTKDTGRLVACFGSGGQNC